MYHHKNKFPHLQEPNFPSTCTWHILNRRWLWVFWILPTAQIWQHIDTFSSTSLKERKESCYSSVCLFTYNKRIYLDFNLRKSFFPPLFIPIYVNHSIFHFFSFLCFDISPLGHNSKLHSYTDLCLCIAVILNW